MRRQLIHMHDQKANQTAMLTRAGKQEAMDAIEGLILLFAVWVLVVIS